MEQGGAKYSLRVTWLPQSLYLEGLATDLAPIYGIRVESSRGRHRWISVHFGLIASGRLQPDISAMNGPF